MGGLILTHHRSRKRILATNVATVVLIIPFLCLVAAMFQFRGPPLWICLGLLALNLAMFGHSTWKVYKQPGDFRCVLDYQGIRCDCPDDTMGATFDVPLSTVREIRQESGMEGGSEYVLVTTDGKEHWLTGNFGNPVSRFVRELRRLCPGARYCEA